jgi:hypothetical protein
MLRVEKERCPSFQLGQHKPSELDLPVIVKALSSGCTSLDTITNVLNPGALISRSSDCDNTAGGVGGGRLTYNTPNPILMAGSTVRNFGLHNCFYQLFLISRS